MFSQRSHQIRATQLAFAPNNQRHVRLNARLHKGHRVHIGVRDGDPRIHKSRNVLDKRPCTGGIRFYE
jgi:hypothetical protein